MQPVFDHDWKGLSVSTYGTTRKFPHVRELSYTAGIVVKGAVLSLRVTFAEFVAVVPNTKNEEGVECI